MSSSLSFSDSILQKVVAQICNDVGWHSAHVSNLNVLVDLLRLYIRKLSTAAVDFANHAGRSEPCIDDLAMVFNFFGVDIGQLQDYVLNVDSSPIPNLQLPFYPVANRQNRVLDQWEENEERPEYYHEWLPSLNPKKKSVLALEAVKTTTNDELPKKLDETENKNEATTVPNGIDENSTKIVNGDKKPENEPIIDDDVFGDKLKIDDSKAPEETPAGNKPVAPEEEILEEQDKDQKKKLVLRFSLGKSTDENPADLAENDPNLAQSSQSQAITDQLKSSRAFLKFIQSSLYLNPEDSTARRNLRAADTKRLPNNHQSRENSPEPNESPNNSTMLETGLNGHDSLKNADADHELNMSNKIVFKPKKKKKLLKENKKDLLDNTGLNSLFSDPIKATIKVKDIGVKKERKKVANKDKGGVEKPPKIKKIKGIKVKGFGLSSKTSKASTDLTLTKLADSNSKLDEFPIGELLDLSMNKSDSAGGLLSEVSKGADGPTPTKKRQYKKREKPKDYVERRGRKPKKPSLKLISPSSGNKAKSSTNLEDGELPPSSPVSNSSFSSVFSRSISPSKFKKSKKSAAFDEGEAAKTLVLMSESNDTNFTSKDDENKIGGDSMDSFGSDSMAEFGGGGDSQKPPSSSKKTAARPSVKRTKGVYSKKIVKSAETVESSEDSSSEGDPNVDSNPVSLLPPLPEITLENILAQANIQSVSDRKRRHSESSISSVGSGHSSQASLSPGASPKSQPASTTEVIKSEKRLKLKSSELSFDDKLEKNSSEEKPKEKHKKNKKHSKEKDKDKHSRHSEGEKEPKKKHKKIKLDKEGKEKPHKEKDKAADKEKTKDKTKPVKPKLSIKLGLQNMEIKKNSPHPEPEMFVDSIKPESITEPEIGPFHAIGSSNMSKDSVFEFDDFPKFAKKPDETLQLISAKKKRGPKKKANSEPQNEPLVFIKSTAKEPKAKNTVKINVASSLFDETASFPEKMPKLISKAKLKEPKIEKEILKPVEDIVINPKKETKSSKSKDKQSQPSSYSLLESIPKIIPEETKVVTKKSKNQDEPKREKEKEHVSSSKKNVPAVAENTRCIVIRETIDETNERIGDEVVWYCPKCNFPDDGTPMIGCDTCDDWYHYVCVGILEEPSSEDSWFCPKCVSRQHEKMIKYDKVKKKGRSSSSKTGKQSSNSSSITITPILPPTKVETHHQRVIPEMTPISFIPINSNPTTTARQPSVTITPTSTPGYKPTGRPRGRPRKDSATPGSRPNLTITPIGPNFDDFSPHSTDPNFLLDFSKQQQQISPSTSNFFPLVSQPQSTPSVPKRSKDICPVCPNLGDLDVMMIVCDKCEQWYHWKCVGIVTAPSPDTTWLCIRCRKKKSAKRSQGGWSDQLDHHSGSGHSSKSDPISLSLTDAKFLAVTGGGSGSAAASSGASSNRRFLSPARRQTQDSIEIPDYPTSKSKETQVYCLTCQQVSTSDDSTLWICCDDCDGWYHFVCEGVTVSPKNEEAWFCKKCIQRQKSIVNQFKKIKR